MHRISRKTVERNDKIYVVDLFVDETQRTPWEDECGHGPVSEWTRRAKAPGERVLCDDNPSGLRGVTRRRFYDFQEAIKIAKRDGWDAPPYRTGTRGETAERAVEADFKRLRAWCNDEWGYVVIAVTLAPDDWDEDDPLETDFAHALWGVESDQTNFQELTIEELIGEIEAEENGR